MSPSDDVARVLAAYRAHAGPDAAASERAWAAVARRARAGEVVALEPEPEPGTATQTWRIAGAAIAAAAVAIAALSLGARALTEQPAAALQQGLDVQAERPAPPPATTRTPMPAPVAAPRPAVLPPPVTPSVAPLAEPPRVRAKPRVVAPPTAVIEPSIDALEITALRRAQGLLRRDPAAALQLLEDHADDYPRSSLAAERAVARITALCNAGRADASRAAADSFAAAHPGSPLLARVRDACRDPSATQTDPRGRSME